MKTTTYICDVCKKSVGPTELKTLSISMKGLTAPNGCTHNHSANKDVCKDCLGKRGIFTVLADDQKSEDVSVKNQKTLEDKLIDILEDLGVSFGE